jgi:hypothetical protein
MTGLLFAVPQILGALLGAMFGLGFARWLERRVAKWSEPKALQATCSRCYLDLQQKKPVG